MYITGIASGATELLVPKKKHGAPVRIRFERRYHRSVLEAPIRNESGRLVQSSEGLTLGWQLGQVCATAQTAASTRIAVTELTAYNTFENHCARLLRTGAAGLLVLVEK